MITPEEFLKLSNENEKSLIKYGKIDPGYAGGRPKIVFDGEDDPSGKRYPYLASYTPVPSERVMLLGNVIIGKVI